MLLNSCLNFDAMKLKVPTTRKSRAAWRRDVRQTGIDLSKTKSSRKRVSNHFFHKIGPSKKMTGCETAGPQKYIQHILCMDNPEAIGLRWL